jgi:hypothetical protein
MYSKAYDRKTYDQAGNLSSIRSVAQIFIGTYYGFFFAPQKVCPEDYDELSLLNGVGINYLLACTRRKRFPLGYKLHPERTGALP